MFKKEAVQICEDLPDAALIKRIKNGERELFDILVRRHYDNVWRYLRYKTGNGETAYDLTQETFLKVVAAFSDINISGGNFAAYIIRVARNLVIDGFRRRTDLCADIEEISEIADPADICGGVSDDDCIRNALSALPAGQREAVILRHICGYRVREIAAITGVPAATVKSRVRLGCEKLRIYLKKEGFE